MNGHHTRLEIREYGEAIWLICECGYETSFGCNVQPEDASAAGGRHRNEIIEAAAAARQCWHSDSFGNAYPAMCETRADWEATGSDGTTHKSCDEHLAQTCDYEGVTSVRMLKPCL